MLTAPQKINTKSMRILSACVKQFVRRTEDNANKQTNEQTNKYLNSSLYSIRYTFIKVSKNQKLV